MSTATNGTSTPNRPSNLRCAPVRRRRRNLLSGYFFRSHPFEFVLVEATALLKRVESFEYVSQLVCTGFGPQFSRLFAELLEQPFPVGIPAEDVGTGVSPSTSITAGISSLFVLLYSREMVLATAGIANALSTAGLCVQAPGILRNS